MALTLTDLPDDILKHKILFPLVSESLQSERAGDSEEDQSKILKRTKGRKYYDVRGRIPQTIEKEDKTIENFCLVNKRCAGIGASPEFWGKDRKKIHDILECRKKPWVIIKYWLNNDYEVMDGMFKVNFNLI